MLPPSYPLIRNPRSLVTMSRLRSRPGDTEPEDDSEDCLVFSKSFDHKEDSKPPRLFRRVQKHSEVS